MAGGKLSKREAAYRENQKAKQQFLGSKRYAKKKEKKLLGQRYEGGNLNVESLSKLLKEKWPMPDYFEWYPKRRELPKSPEELDELLEAQEELQALEQEDQEEELPF